MYRKRRDFRTEMATRGWTYEITGFHRASQTWEWGWVKRYPDGKIKAKGSGSEEWKKDAADSKP